MPAEKAKSRKGNKQACSLRFEAARIESLYEVLDAVAWLNLPTVAEVAQFAGIDPRTAGKLLKNAVTVGLAEVVKQTNYCLVRPYPSKAPVEQKRLVVREALIVMPLLMTVRQFLKLGDSLDSSLRKAAAVQKIQNYEPAALTPLLSWAKELEALDPAIDPGDLADEASQAKEQRHKDKPATKVVFLSHSSKDKPIVRQLATDLAAANVTVWLDEQRIRVGDSISEGIAQGLAESDYFLVALSDSSVGSEWVKKELNAALVDEIARRKVKILPVLLSKTEIPIILRDKKYADFTKGYKLGLAELLAAIKE